MSPEIAREIELLRRSQQIARLGYCELPLDGGAACCSAEFYQLLDIVAGELSGGVEALLRYVHPADRPAVQDSLNKVASTAEGCQLDLRIVTAGGELRHVHAECRLEAGQNGGPPHLFVVAYDGTGNRTVQILSQRLEQMLDNPLSEIVVYAVDDLRVVRLNARALSNLGYSREDGEQLRCLDLYADFDATSLETLLAPLRDGRSEEIVFETRQRRRDGTFYPVEVHLQMMREQREPVFVAIASDTSERRAAAEALVLSEQRYRTVFDNSGTALALVGPGGELELVNEAFAQMLRLSAEALISGQRFTDHVAEPDRDVVAEQLKHCRERAVAAGAGEAGGGLCDIQPQRLEFRFRTSRGKLGWGYLAVAAQPGSPLVVASVIDISELKRTQASLQYLANHDALTGLPNRTLFRDRLRVTVAREQRVESFTAVLLIDLDRFKNINDTLGHHWGDELLRAVSGRITACVRDGDLVARLGGDEFGIVLGDLSRRSDAGRVANNILAALRAPVELRGHRLFISASIGIALHPDDADTIDELMVAADVAMYRAKERGKNGFHFYTREMNSNSSEQLDLESGLRYALERQELFLVYQPQVDLRNGRVYGVEALLRWQHPERGLISPDQFVPLLEETGLILSVGEWVLEEACRQSLQWSSEGLPALRVAVNLSPRQVAAGLLPETVKQVLQSTGLAAELLELEITESLLMQDVENTRSVLESISDLGVSLSIDDFGTGYSSLAYLKRLPVQSLKIDRSFVMDMASDRDDAVIVRSTIDLGHNLGLEVVAEGLEEGESLHTLRQMGCDYAQGFFLSRPLPAAQIGAAVLQLSARCDSLLDAVDQA